MGLFVCLGFGFGLVWVFFVRNLACSMYCVVLEEIYRMEFVGWTENPSDPTGTNTPREFASPSATPVQPFIRKRVFVLLASFLI